MSPQSVEHLPKERRRVVMMTRSSTATLILAAAAAILLGPSSAVGSTPQGTPGAVYTMTNSATGNEVVVFDRVADGSLRFGGTYHTGGLGSGDGLGNQGGVVLSDDGRWLLAVNAGSGEVSVFRVAADGLVLTDTASSGGVRPVSVTIHQDLVYVVHAGGAVGDVDEIAGLRLASDGTLSLLPASQRALSAPSVGPAQVTFSPDGRFLLVTEKGTNLISTFAVLEDGYAAEAVPNPASGETPFAMDFGKRNQVFISEVFGGAEDAGAVSSYQLESDGSLTLLDGSVPNTETAPCWLVVTQGGRYVFTTNTPDDSLSAYAIDFDGSLSLLDQDGRSGEPGAGTRPLDMDLSDDGRFLYTLDIGTDAISTFRVLPDGGLEHIAVSSDVPDGANGLAAR
jgi:6-phosphogluconolactonase (cycloisomerase 2 family)